jgi:membrane protease YdiL (CAAX protease family)
MTASAPGFVKRHPLAAYFILAYAISWIIWSPLVLSARGMITAQLPSYWHYFGAAGPILAAILVTRITEGASGLRGLFGRMVRWRVGIHWLAIALLSPFALFALAAAILRMTGAPWPDFRDIGRSQEFPRMGLLAATLFYTLTFGFGEETGWRGFALPRLQRDHSAMTATLWLTAGWALWHTPAFLYRPAYMGLDAGGVAGWAFSLLVGSILLTWMYNTTGGSILVVALWHGTLEVAYMSRIAEANHVVVTSVLVIAWGILVLLVAGPARLSRAGKVVAAPRARPAPPHLQHLPQYPPQPLPVAAAQREPGPVAPRVDLHPAGPRAERSRGGWRPASTTWSSRMPSASSSREKSSAPGTCTSSPRTLRPRSMVKRRESRSTPGVSAGHYARSSASRRSFTRSPGSSSPRESRMPPGWMPARACSWVGTVAWVMEAGCSMSVRTWPRLTARVTASDRRAR